MPLDQATIDRLTAPKVRKSATAKPKKTELGMFTAYEVLPQTSAYVRFNGKEFRCKSGGCGCSTTITIQGVPYCSIHTIQILADLLDQQINHFPNRGPEVEAQLKTYLKPTEGLNGISHSTISS